VVDKGGHVVEVGTLQGRGGGSGVEVKTTAPRSALQCAGDPLIGRLAWARLGRSPRLVAHTY
jgi:hypothetical protein